AALLAQQGYPKRELEETGMRIEGLSEEELGALESPEDAVRWSATIARARLERARRGGQGVARNCSTRSPSSAPARRSR
ncbi:MAG: hypothetical protein ACR2MC_03585, partial [Actinomycetota bacterium]